MDNIKLISKDNFYALYKNTRYMTYSYRCSHNSDIAFCEYSSPERLETEIKSHIKQKYEHIKVIEFMGDNWVKEEKQRLTSLFRLLEVLKNDSNNH